VLYTLAAGLSRGRRASVVAAVGCTLGVVPHMAAAILGLAALLYASSIAFQTMKLLGVAYLLFIALNTLREQGTFTLAEKEGERTPTQVIVSAILVNFLNPKLSLFFFAFLPQSSQPANRTGCCACSSSARSSCSLRSPSSWVTASQQRRYASTS
jgi:threonine/homoserine/homoserine lactone efflux protein